MQTVLRASCWYRHACERVELELELELELVISSHQTPLTLHTDLHQNENINDSTVQWHRLNITLASMAYTSASRHMSLRPPLRHRLSRCVRSTTAAAAIARGPTSTAAPLRASSLAPSWASCSSAGSCGRALELARPMLRWLKAAARRERRTTTITDKGAEFQHPPS